MVAADTGSTASNGSSSTSSFGAASSARRQPDLLAHAGRVTQHQGAVGAVQVEHREQLVDPLLRRTSRRQAVQPPEVGQHLPAGEPLGHRQAVGQHARPAAWPRPAGPDVRAEDLARCRRRAAAGRRPSRARWSCRRRWGRPGRRTSRPERSGRPRRPRSFLPNRLVSPESEAGVVRRHADDARNSDRPGGNASSHPSGVGLATPGWARVRRRPPGRFGETCAA